MLSRKDTPRGKLLSQYVLARITRMDGVDIGLFDYDRHNPLYFFMLNAEEQIYMRYGGRDAASVNTYLNLDSLEVALEQGLELHSRYLAGEWKAPNRPEPLFPEQFPLLVERTSARGACVECHLIGDFQNIHRELDGTLDKVRHMYRSPDIKTLGIHLDIPKGLVVKEAAGAADAAGMRSGDRITHLNGTRVWTFGDFQYHYDQVERTAREVQIAVDRGGEPVDLTVALPGEWWLTDLTFRQWTVEPRIYFSAEALTEAEKIELGADPEGFASRVTRVESIASLLGNHELQPGDIILAVDGVGRDEAARTAGLHIKLRTVAGEGVELDIVRNGERMKLPLKTARMQFRK